MAAIIHQKDKRSGITYAYESISYWDKEKKQSRAKRRLIGRVTKDGKIVPTDGRGRKRKNKEEAQSSKPSIDKPETTRSFYGATYLLDSIGEKLGLTKDLKYCFGDRYKQILSTAYYLILEDNAPLYRFEKWSSLHKHPYDKNISSQRSSELFASITEESKVKFFKQWSRHKQQDEFWAYDTTSISSYSEQLKQIQYGHNKEDDKLAQLNLAVVFGEKSNLPFYYRKLAGNIPDSKTITHLLADLKQLDFEKLKLVLDRGFYSKDNINELYEKHLKFLVSTRMSLSFIQSNLENIYDNFCSYEYYLPQYELYAHTVSAIWKYKKHRPYKKDTITKEKRVYLHYYFNIEKAAHDEKVFDNKLIQYKNKIISNQKVKEHQIFYDKYFINKKTPKKGVSVDVKTDEVAKAKKNYGFFVLLSNEKMDATKALQLYRNKDVVEKAFGNLKERLSMRRMLVSSEQSLDGKLFVEFIALIFLSYIKKQMQVKNLYKQYTLQTLLDKVDVIEYFEYPNTKPRVGEILEKQKDIFEAMEVEVPR
jgi:transposase